MCLLGTHKLLTYSVPRLGVVGSAFHSAALRRSFISNPALDLGARATGQGRRRVSHSTWPVVSALCSDTGIRTQLTQLPLPTSPPTLPPPWVSSREWHAAARCKPDVFLLGLRRFFFLFVVFCACPPKKQLPAARPSTGRVSTGLFPPYGPPLGAISPLPCALCTLHCAAYPVQCPCAASPGQGALCKLRACYPCACAAPTKPPHPGNLTPSPFNWVLSPPLCMLPGCSFFSFSLGCSQALCDSQWAV